MKKKFTIVTSLLFLSFYVQASNTWDFKSGTEGWGSYGPDATVSHDEGDNLVVSYNNDDANFDYPTITVDLSSSPIDASLIDTFYMKYEVFNWPEEYQTVLMNVQFNTDVGAKYAPVNFIAADGYLKFDIRNDLAADWGILPEDCIISRIRIELPHSSAAGQANFSKWENAQINIDYISLGQAPPFAPISKFTADISSGTAPMTIQFNDESEDFPDSWAWDFDNDGTVDATEQNPSYTYTEPGSYSVKLTVTNTTGSDDSIRTDYIKVTIPAPLAKFSANKTIGEAPLSVQFTDESENSPNSWAWDFDNDGTVDATEQNPSYTYTEAGTYSVKLTVTNTTGSDDSIRIDYIEVTAATDIKNSLSGKSITIIPNPTTGRININEKYEKLLIYSLSGKLVKQFNNYSPTQNISDLNNGVYFIKLIKDNDIMGVAKLVKE